MPVPSPLKSLVASACLGLALHVQAGPIVLSEGFEESDGAPGWTVNNLSADPGGSWFFGNTGVFSAQAGSANSYYATNFLAANSGAINSWLISPLFDLHSGGQLSFWTRSAGAFPDSLSVLFSATGSLDPSDFTELLQINGAEAADGYPSDWTQFDVGYAGSGGQGRIAFAYRISDVAVAGDYIGIDSVQIVARSTPVSEPGMLALAGIALLLGRRAQRRP